MNVNLPALAASALLVSSPLLMGAEPEKPAPPPAEKSAIDPALFTARPIKGGYTWTLASRLGDMLHLAETMFGPRDPTYTVLGVEFVEDNPRVWYPGNRKFVVIQLHGGAMRDMSRACYQLAHETVHLLAPTGGQAADNFEEGLADYFASYYMRTKMNQPTWHSGMASYRKASALIAPYLDRDPEVIRRLRAVQPAISSITAEALRKELAGLSEEDAEFLVKRFQRTAPVEP